MPRPRRNLTLTLPDEFIELCEIQSYVSAPRADGYSSNGSDERSMAWDYYERVGYPWWNKPAR